MPASPTIQQTASAASTTAAPATFTLNFTASQTTSFLAAFVVGAMSAGGGTFTPPSWVAQGSSVNSNIAVWLYTNANNGGGITTFAMTAMANFNAVAVCMIEINNMPPSSGLVLDAGTQNFTVNNAAAASASTSAITPTLGNEVWFGVAASLTGSSLTTANKPAAGLGSWNTIAAATSTNGATNIQIQPFYSVPGPIYPAGGVFQIVANNAPNASNLAFIVAFRSNATSGIGSMSDAGIAGYMAASAGLGGAVGG